MARTQFVATKFQLGTTARPGRVLYATPALARRMTPALARQIRATSRAAGAAGVVRLAGGRAYYATESNRSEEE